MGRWMFLWMLVAVTIAVALAQQAQSQSRSHSPKAPESAADNGQVQQITLPQYPLQIPPGPNAEVYRRDCLACHTARYVSMQPHFPKAVWQSEVKKMVDVYGAPIPDTDQALIVEYLVAVKGVEATPAQGATTK